MDPVPGLLALIPEGVTSPDLVTAKDEGWPWDCRFSSALCWDCVAWGSECRWD